MVVRVRTSLKNKTSCLPGKCMYINNRQARIELAPPFTLVRTVQVKTGYMLFMVDSVHVFFLIEKALISSFSVVLV